MTDIEQRARNLIASEYGPTEYLGTGNTMPGEGPARVRAIREGRGDEYWEMRVVKKALEAHDATKADVAELAKAVDILLRCIPLIPEAMRPDVSNAEALLSRFIPPGPVDPPVAVIQTVRSTPHHSHRCGIGGGFPHRTRQARPHHQGATAMTLPELSAAATQGEWHEAYLDHNDQAVIQGDHTEIATFWHHCVGSLEKEMQANAQFVCALVNAYRSGQLVERDGVAKPQDHWTAKTAINSCRSLIDAGNTLCLMAETSGGTAGRDAALVAAIDHWAAERDKHKQVLRIIELEGHDPEVGAGHASLSAALTAIKGGVDDADG